MLSTYAFNNLKFNSFLNNFNGLRLKEVHFTFCHRYAMTWYFTKMLIMNLETRKTHAQKKVWASFKMKFKSIWLSWFCQKWRTGMKLTRYRPFQLSKHYNWARKSGYFVFHKIFHSPLLLTDLSIILLRISKNLIVNILHSKIEEHDLY